MREPEILQLAEYPFARLDEMVEMRLNPMAGWGTKEITQEDWTKIKALFISECDGIWANLKTLIFGLLSEEKIKIAISQHLLVITHLKKQINDNLSEPTVAPCAGFDYTTLTDKLDRLESLIRARYEAYCAGGSPEIRHKILCTLSVDQIGLILKAADDTRLIQARSLSQVFKSIVPFLSTSNKTDISFDSMRASTYHPEASDKEKAIVALERMIGKIRDYR